MTPKSDLLQAGIDCPSPWSPLVYLLESWTPYLLLSNYNGKAWGSSSHLAEPANLWSPSTIQLRLATGHLSISHIGIQMKKMQWLGRRRSVIFYLFRACWDSIRRMARFIKHQSTWSHIAITDRVPVNDWVRKQVLQSSVDARFSTTPLLRLVDPPHNSYSPSSCTAVEFCIWSKMASLPWKARRRSSFIEAQGM